MKKRTRNQIADAAVRRWCRFYELTPYFWNANPETSRCQILRKNKSTKQLRRRPSSVQYGEPEDRADCMAMIVGTLFVKGFDSYELAELLEVSTGTVWIYRQQYLDMPNESRRALIQLDGEKAREFYESIIEHHKADQAERLMNTRSLIETKLKKTTRSRR